MAAGEDSKCHCHLSSRGLSADQKVTIASPRPQSVIGGGVEGVSAEDGERISREVRRPRER
eukprot:12815-Pyramimonas_sp.AAC.1